MCKRYSLAALVLGVTVAGLASAASPVRFRDLAGTVSAAGPTGPLWTKSMSWQRCDFRWWLYEPSPGVFDEQYMQQFKDSILAFKAQGVHVLPILDYNASWSWDRSARTFEDRGYKYEITPRQDGRFDVAQYAPSPEGWSLIGVEIREGTDAWPVAAEHQADWQNFVRRVVTALESPPYGIQYFQVWNEPQVCSGFWFGDHATFVQRVYKPAADIIHELGGKVVFGGLSCCEPLEEMYGMFDDYGLWSITDVLSIHYWGLENFNAVQEAMNQRGYHDIALWQTEVGFDLNPSYISDFYPRLLYWALTHNWTDPDRYKAFYFAFWSPDSPDGYGYGRMLYTGNNLSPQGHALLALGNLLDGDGLRLYDGVTNDAGLAPTIYSRWPGIESFAVDNRIVVVVHMQEGAVQLGFPMLEGWQAAHAERINFLGDPPQDLDGNLTYTPGSGVVIDVPAVDEEALYAGYNDGLRTFYVQLTLRSPGDVFRTLPYGGWALVGSSWDFEAELSSPTGKPTYTWLRDGVPIDGAASLPTYSITGLSIGDDGLYACRVSDGSAMGPYTTPAVRLTVVERLPAVYSAGILLLLIAVCAAAAAWSWKQQAR